MNEHSEMMIIAGEISIQAGEDHDLKNNVPGAIGSYGTSVQCLLSAAVNGCNSVADGISFLSDRETQTLLLRLAELETKAEPINGGQGVYALLVNAHASILLSEIKLAKNFVKLANRNSIQKNSSKLWNAYSNGFRSVLSSQRYDKPTLSGLRGLEVYWESHVEMMNAIANDGQLLDPCILLAREFTKRNSDKRLHDDGKRIEGTGQGPILWDFRIASWAALVESKTGERIQELPVDWPFSW